VWAINFNKIKRQSAQGCGQQGICQSVGADLNLVVLRRTTSPIPSSDLMCIKAPIAIL
jgi:hypothetical protein